MMMKIDEETKMLLEMGEINQSDIDKANNVKEELRAIADNIRYALHSLINGSNMSKEQVKQHLIDHIDAFFLDKEKKKNANQ